MHARRGETEVSISNVYVKLKAMHLSVWFMFLKAILMLPSLGILKTLDN